MLRNTDDYHENEFGYERIRGIHGLLGLFDLGTFDIMPYRADQYCSSVDSTTYHGPLFHFHIRKRYEHRFPNHSHTFDFSSLLIKITQGPLLPRSSSPSANDRSLPHGSISAIYHPVPHASYSLPVEPTFIACQSTYRIPLKKFASLMPFLLVLLIASVKSSRTACAS